MSNLAAWWCRAATPKLPSPGDRGAPARIGLFQGRRRGHRRQTGRRRRVPNSGTGPGRASSPRSRRGRGPIFPTRPARRARPTPGLHQAYTRPTPGLRRAYTRPTPGLRRANGEMGAKEPRTPPLGPRARAARPPPPPRGLAGADPGGPEIVPPGPPPPGGPAPPGGISGDDEALKSAGFRAAWRFPPPPLRRAGRRLAPDAMSSPWTSLQVGPWPVAPPPPRHRPEAAEAGESARFWMIGLENAAFGGMPSWRAPARGARWQPRRRRDPGGTAPDPISLSARLSALYARLDPTAAAGSTIARARRNTSTPPPRAFSLK